jgi:prepilin-type N-terminal cleavage/methylation domain-containing protein
MMKLKEKLQKRGGFTLVEMLIVVAIIAILVAVSIPIANTALEKARTATDSANERAAKAEGVIKYLSGDYTAPTSGNSVSFAYDAVNGQLVEITEGTSFTYGSCSYHKDGYIKVTINVTDGTVSVEWTKGKGLDLNNTGAKADA